MSAAGNEEVTSERTRKRARLEKETEIEVNKGTEHEKENKGDGETTKSKTKDETTSKPRKERKKTTDIRNYFETKRKPQTNDSTKGVTNKGKNVGLENMREGENILLDRTSKTKENLEIKTSNKTRGLVENIRKRQIIDIQQQTVLHQRSVPQRLRDK